VFPGTFCFQIAILWWLLICHCDHGKASSLCCFFSALYWVGSSVYIYNSHPITKSGTVGEISQDEMERDRMILQLEDCLNVYRKKVDQTRKQKADLLQTLSVGEADIKKILSALGECDSFSSVSFSFVVHSMVVSCLIYYSIIRSYLFSRRSLGEH
jgi:hypothetical protein